MSTDQRQFPIPCKQWDSHSPEQQVLLTRLGFYRAKPKAPRMSGKTTRINPYVIEIKKKCKLCGSEASEKREMIPFEEDGESGLVSRPLIEDEWNVNLPIVTQRMKVPTCKECFGFLVKNYSKETLASMVIEISKVKIGND